MVAVVAQMRARRDTAANWTSENPTLGNAEIAYETDTGLVKIGDGSTAWNDLPYYFGGTISEDQIAVGAATANTVEGSSNLTYNGTEFFVSGKMIVDQQGADDALVLRDGVDDLFRIDEEGYIIEYARSTVFTDGYGLVWDDTAKQFIVNPVVEEAPDDGRTYIRFNERWISSGLPQTEDGEAEFLLNADGGTLADRSKSRAALTVSGAAVSTTEVKYGSHSIIFDGTDDYIRFPHEKQMTPNLGDFTIEFWIWSSVANDDKFIIGGRDSIGSLHITTGSGVDAGKIRVVSQSTMVGTTVVSDSAWHHVAVVRTGGNMRLYVDGTQENSFTDSFNYNGETGTWHIGENDFGGGGGNHLAAYLDDIRYTLSAVYTGAFTPPTKRFKNYLQSNMIDISDVDLTGLANGNALMYSSTTDLWEARDLVEADISDFGTYAARTGTIAANDVAFWSDPTTLTGEATGDFTWDGNTLKVSESIFSAQFPYVGFTFGVLNDSYAAYNIGWQQRAMYFEARLDFSDWSTQTTGDTNLIGLETFTATRNDWSLETQDLSLLASGIFATKFAGTGTVVEGVGIKVVGEGGFTAGTPSITNYYGLKIEDRGGTGTLNVTGTKYGVHVDDDHINFFGGDTQIGNFVFDSAGAAGATEDNYVLTFDWNGGTDPKIRLEAATGGGGSIGGSIANDQVAVGAATANDIEGSAGLTFDGTTLTVATDIDFTNNFSIEQGGNDIIRWSGTELYLYAGSGTPSQAFRTSDSRAIVGGTTSFTTFDFRRQISDGAVGMYGGQSISDGGGITVYGSTRSGLAGDIIMTSGSNNILFQWDEADGELRVSTGTGVKTLAVTIDSSQVTDFANRPTVGAESLAYVSELPAGGIGGSITDNQIAVGATTADEIEGFSHFTYDGTTLAFGSGASGTVDIRHGGGTAGYVGIYGGNGNFDGGNVILYGSTEASNAGDIAFASNSLFCGFWDESAGEWTFSTGSGLKTLALTLDSSQNATFAGAVTVGGNITFDSGMIIANSVPTFSYTGTFATNFTSNNASSSFRFNVFDGLGLQIESDMDVNVGKDLTVSGGTINGDSSSAVSLTLKSNYTANASTMDFDADTNFTHSFRFGRNTNASETAARVLSTWFTGDGTSGEAMELDHETGELTVNGEIKTSASTTSRPSINIPHGTAPTSPSNGDFWTTTGGVFARVNGVTQQLDGGGGGLSASADEIITGAWTFRNASLVFGPNTNNQGIEVTLNNNTNFAEYIFGAVATSDPYVTGYGSSHIGAPGDLFLATGTNSSANMSLTARANDGTGTLVAHDTAGSPHTCLGWGNGSGAEPDLRGYYDSTEVFRTRGIQVGTAGLAMGPDTTNASGYIVTNRSNDGSLYLQAHNTAGTGPSVSIHGTSALVNAGTVRFNTENECLLHRHATTNYKAPTVVYQSTSNVTINSVTAANFFTFGVTAGEKYRYELWLQFGGVSTIDVDIGFVFTSGGGSFTGSGVYNSVGSSYVSEWINFDGGRHSIVQGSGSSSRYRIDLGATASHYIRVTGFIDCNTSGNFACQMDLSAAGSVSSSDAFCMVERVD